MAEQKPLILKDGRETVMKPGVDTIDPQLINKSIDGGSASSVYLTSQQQDGGDANG